MNPKSGKKTAKENKSSTGANRNCKMSLLPTGNRVSPMLRQKNNLDVYLDLVNPKKRNNFDNGEFFFVVDCFPLNNLCCGCPLHCLPLFLFISYYDINNCRCLRNGTGVGDATSTTSMDVVKVGLEKQVGLELEGIQG